MPIKAPTVAYTVHSTECAVYPVIAQAPYILLYYRVCSETKPEENGGDRKMKNSLAAIRRRRRVARINRGGREL